MPTIELTLTAPKTSGEREVAAEKSGDASPSAGDFGQLMERVMAPDEPKDARTSLPADKGKSPPAPGRATVPKAPDGLAADAAPAGQLPATTSIVRKMPAEIAAGPADEQLDTAEKTPAELISLLLIPTPDLNQPLPIFLSPPLVAQFTAGGVVPAPAVSGSAPSIAPVSATVTDNRGVMPGKPASAMVPDAAGLTAVKTAPPIILTGPAQPVESLAASVLAAGKNASASLNGEPALTAVRTMGQTVVPDAVSGQPASAFLPDEWMELTTKPVASLVPADGELAVGKNTGINVPAAPGMVTENNPSPVRWVDSVLAAGKTPMTILPDEISVTANPVGPVAPMGLALAAGKYVAANPPAESVRSAELNLPPILWAEPAGVAGKMTPAVLSDESTVTTTATPALAAGLALAAGKYASATLPNQQPTLTTEINPAPARWVAPVLAADKTGSAILPAELTLTPTPPVAPVVPVGLALAAEKYAAANVSAAPGTMAEISSSPARPLAPVLGAGKIAPMILPEARLVNPSLPAAPAGKPASPLVVGDIAPPVLPAPASAAENFAPRYPGEVLPPAVKGSGETISRSVRLDAVTVDGKIFLPPSPAQTAASEKLATAGLPVGQGATAPVNPLQNPVPPTEAWIETATLPEKWGVVSNALPTRAAESAGMGVATQDLPMKKTGNTNKVAELDAKVLPGGMIDAAREQGLPSLASGRPVRLADSRNSDSLPPLPVAGMPAAILDEVQNLIALPSLMDVRMKNVERTHDMVALHALRLMDSKSDSMSVVIKPGAGTELSLELRHRNGGIEVEAILQRGDFQLLNEHWPDLQQKLELRGIKLSALGGEGDFTSAGNGHFSQQQSSREEEAQQASAFAEFTLAVNAQGATARLAASGWESWA